MQLTTQQKRLVLLTETVVLCLVAGWLLLRSDRLADPFAILVALALVALGDLATAGLMQRFAPTRVNLAVADAGADGATVVRGFDHAERGVVRVRGEFWQARCAHGQQLKPGDSVRITGRDGLILQVEARSPGAEH